MLTIKGERKLAQDEKEENFHRIERRFGNFVRRFTLPMTADTASEQAGCDAGVVSITLQIGTGDSERGRKQVDATNAA